MSIITMKQSISKRQQRGQGMTEYIIIVALIAVAAIGLVGAFGGVVKAQFGAMAAALGGADGTAAQTRATTDGQAAAAQANGATT